MAEKTRNVQVIDGADNCTYDIFTIAADDFAQLFPDQGQDVEFAEDFFARLGAAAAQPIWDRMWATRPDKKHIEGIHGTLFVGLEHKKRFYPTRREDQMVVLSCIVLRMTVDGPLDAVQAVSQQLQDALSPFATVAQTEIEPYRKIEGACQVFCTLRARDAIEDAYEEMLRRLATGWREPTPSQFGRWTVWNRGNGEFLAPAVRWAHLELIRA
jgi:hypothetical protein